MKRIGIIFIILLCIVSIEVKSQTTTCEYDSVSRNYVISFQQDTLEKLIFYPKTKIIPTIRAWIIISNDTIKYCYRLTNSDLSEQHLSDFYLPNNYTIYDVKKPDSDWSISNSLKTGGLHWSSVKLNHYTLPGEDYYEIGMPPNSTVDGFIYSSTGLPSIVDCYFQGFRLSGSDHELPGDVTDIISTLEAFPLNYVKGTTIGPTSVPNPFVPLNFLDTLVDYNTQSRTLGWITTQPTADKYLTFFTSAKASLQTNNIGAARATLNSVLVAANQDSSSTLTSEAYALIRYNTEYLLQQLPVPPSGFMVKLVNSSGTKLTSGTLRYYEGSWKDAVNNNDGTFIITTNQKTLSLRMTYEYGTQTKSNVPVGNDTVVFQTVSTQIRLQNSNGALIDTGTVQYYAGAWRSFGTTTNGIAAKELLANTYSFRMAYANASKDKQQDIGANPIVIFQTINAAVQLQNSGGALIDTGVVQYYAGSWRSFRITTNGIATKELLPNTYSFRMTYAYASKDKQQDIGTNPTVIFQTVNAAVQLQNSQGSLMDQSAGGGTVQYYSGAWRDFGTTTNGTATKELLPNDYSFRMTYAYASKDKQQDIGTNPTVVFQTVNAIVQLKNSQGSLIDQGTVQYYSGAWRTLGTTSNGVASKELLPNSYSFRMTYEYVSNDKTQDLSTNNTVNFSTVLCTVRVKNSQNQPVDNALASYYSGAWRQIGLTVNGEITKELLPANLSFRVKLGTVQQDKTQNLSTSSVVEFVVQP